MIKATNYKLISLSTLLVICLGANSYAVEIVLHERAKQSGAVIRLGDIADISAASPEMMHDLATTPLLPSPAPGTTEFLQRSQLRDLLASRGIDTTQLIILGAKAVEIGEIKQTQKLPRKPAVKQTLRNSRPELPMQTTLVTTRKIERGDFIRAADVELRQEPGHKNRSVATSLEEVVGMEASRNLPEGAVIYKNQVRKPLLVLRGESVEVYATTGGISVKTYAVARQDGALGDLVQVQTLDKKERYMAYVAGRGELEVYAPGQNIREVAKLENRSRKF